MKLITGWNAYLLKISAGPNINLSAISNPVQIFCDKAGKLTARTFGAQQSEISIKIAIANKAIRAAKPVSVRVQ